MFERLDLGNGNGRIKCIYERLNLGKGNGYEAIVNVHWSATLTLSCDYQKQKFLGKFED